MAQGAEFQGGFHRARAIAVLFTVTIFTSALLLFFVQPMFTRMVLPNIGGAAAVWTTAMLFFQTVLIGGYLYAHLMTRYVPVLAQVAIHLGLVLLALTFLPLTVPADWAYDPARPVVTQTLWLYTISVGLPFAVLSANAPLIQSWYRQSGGPNADDPYFLYAASNLGSLIALLAFPLIAEPFWGVTAISGAWSYGFMALGPMLLVTGLLARRPAEAKADLAASAATTSLTPRTIAYWAFLAFIPSSLMLCVTSKISTDLGSFPLVWVVPLALYLLTFVLVFAAKSPLTSDRLGRLLPVALAVLVFFNLKQTATLSLFAVFLAAFFVVGLAVHRMLFEARPDARHLTVFYLTMSAGGALGGLFNSILAPLAFDRLLEYPIMLILIAALLALRPVGNVPRQLSTGLILGVLALLPLFLTIPEIVALSPMVKTMFVAVCLLFVYLAYREKPIVPAAALTTIVGLWAFVGGGGNLLLTDRSFFGLHVVKTVGDLRIYSNGNTVHGAQLINETGDRPTPLTYYYPKGIMAKVLTMSRSTPVTSVGIVGLGTGSLACYKTPGQEWHFYEIDQKVVDIAMNPDYFSFMADCAPDAEVHLGDARIVLQGQQGLRFDTLVIDAYSSDAIPIHLATIEAIRLYLDRLNQNGILVFHISNRFYDLEKPLAVAAKLLKLEGRMQSQSMAAVSAYKGAQASQVVVLARSAAALGTIATDPDWQALPEPTIDPWTDDHANLLATLR